jgi:outer membrane receptor protein involved in Fe transport
VAAFYPVSNQPGDPLLQTNNFRANVLSTFHQYQLDAKIDHQITSNQRFSVRYSHLGNDSTVPTVVGSGSFGDGTNYATSVHNAALDYVWTAKPNLLLNLRAGLDRVDGPGFTTYPSLQSVGFPSVLEANGLTRMPMIDMDDGPYTGLFTQCCVDTAFAHTLYTYAGALNWVRGTHSIKLGGEQRLFYNNFWQPDSPTGTFGFSQVTTANDPLAGDITQGNPIAGLLIGYGDNGGSYITIRPRVADKSIETAFYVQDDWKVNPRLTLNLGLRYEWSNPYTERYNRVEFANFTGNSGITVPGLPLQSGPFPARRFSLARSGVPFPPIGTTLPRGSELLSLSRPKQ